MSDKIKFKLSRTGVRALMQSAEAEQMCASYANRAVAQLGPGYEASTHKGKTRANASVMATTYATRKANMEDNTILKALR